MEGISKDQQQNTLRRTGQLLSSLQLNPTIAVDLLNQEAEAAKNSNDPDDAAFFTRLATAAADPAQGPSVAFKAIVQSAAAIPGSDKFFETIDKGLSTARSEAEAKPKLAELEAKAIEAGVKAENARPLAKAELKKIEAETLAPSVREAIDFKNLSPADQTMFQNLQILKKPPAAMTKVDVFNVDKTASAELGKLIPDLYNQGNAASTQLADIARYRVSLDTAITGPFADQRLAGARIANALGFVGDKGINSSRELIQGNAEMALGARGMLKGQGEITKDEQKLLIQARAGDINFTKGELKTLFNVFERASTAQYTQSRKLLESASKESPTARMFLDNMQPLAQPEPPKPAAPPAPAVPAAPAAPGMPAGFRVIQRG
jgi:hypothetical protein